jgi:subtilisin family serine protease
VAGILCAKRGSVVPAICPDCTVVVRPIFAETMGAARRDAQRCSEELAQAIVECIGAGARVLNISADLAPPAIASERWLEEALDHAARHGVVVVVAAGNQGEIDLPAVVAPENVAGAAPLKLWVGTSAGTVSVVAGWDVSKMTFTPSPV